MMKRVVGSIILAMTLLAHVVAQQDAELDQTGNKLARFIETRMPGWQHKRGTLIQGSKDVIVEVWTFPNRVVKVSMTRRKSVEETHERLTTFAQEEGDARELKGFGDEAYSWGAEGSNIIFRRGKYTISVATIADVERDVDAQALTREQKRERRKSEMRRLSRELAKHAANAIDAP
jgi:hypothetical protein